MKITLVAISAILMLNITACSQKQTDDNNDVIVLDFSKSIQDTAFVNEIDKEFIVLSGEPSNRKLQSLNKMIINKNNLIAFDEKNVNVYELPSGKYLRSVSFFGRGPREYSYLVDVSVNNDNIYILDGATNKILQFTMDGTYVNFREIAHRPIESMMVKDSGFVLHKPFINAPDENIKSSEYAFCVTDNDLNVVDSIEMYDEFYTEMGRVPTIIEGEDKAFANNIFSNQFHVFYKNKDKRSKTYTVDFAGNGINKDNIRDFNKFFSPDNKGLYLFTSPVIVGDWMVGNIQENGKNRKTFFYNMATKELYEDSACFKGSVIFFGGGYFYAELLPSSIGANGTTKHLSDAYDNGDFIISRFKL